MTDVKRGYKMTNPALCTLVNNTVSFMTRDNVEFTARAVTVTLRTAFAALGTAYAVFPSDDEYKGLITIEVDAKAALREGILLKVQKISGYIQQKWGMASGQYKRMGIAKIQTSGEDEFLFRAREVARIGTEYLADLTAMGLTQPQLDALTADATSFESKIRSVNDAKATRETKTRERIVKGNELYALTIKYCKVGKLIWENVDSSKYNDYIIYETTYSQLPKPQNLHAVWDIAISKIGLSWDVVADATYYEVFSSIVPIDSASGSYDMLGTFGSTPQNMDSMNNKRNYFKIKAKNDTQRSDYSDEVWVDCLPV